jgi:hypothetical protein
MKKTSDAVGYMRKRREELSRAYAGLGAEHVRAQIRQAWKDDRLWKRTADQQPPPTTGKRMGDCQSSFISSEGYA